MPEVKDDEDWKGNPGSTWGTHDCRAGGICLYVPADDDTLFREGK